MSDPDSPAAPALPRRTISQTRHSRWPGWIWSVPIAAVGIVAWLAVRAFSERGVEVSVTFTDAAGMKERDTKVMYRGLEVGEVRGLKLTPDRQQVQVDLDLDKDVKKDLTTGTQFYLEGGEVSLSDPASLKAVVAGPSIAMIPGKGTPTQHFSGRLGRPPDRLAVSLPYVLHFEGDAGRLKAGAPVSLRGFTVGKVSRVDLTTETEAGRISTTALIELDPTRFHLSVPASGGGPARHGDWDATLRAALANLVQHGLRATLTQAPPLVGAEEVELVMSPGETPAMLDTSGPYPEIPTEKGGLGSLPQQIAHLPIQQIGDNVRAITEHIKTLSASPKLQESIDHLDRSLAQLDRTLGDAGPKIAPTLQSVQQTVDSLRGTAAAVDSTAEAARKLLGGGAASPNGNLQQAVHELTGTARAIRTLANYLDQHPEALIRGRGAALDEESR
jgi:paraquat-inducible protein B